MNEQRIGRLVEARQLEELPADDPEVSGIWRAALREWADASVQGLSAPGRFTHLYQAAFRAATAMVRAAGYRCRGAVGGHHHVTFHAAGALGDRDLERLSDALQELRGERHRALDGDEDDLEEAEVQAAERLVARVCPPGAAGPVRVGLQPAGGAEVRDGDVGAVTERSTVIRSKVIAMAFPQMNLRSYLVNSRVGLRGDMGEQCLRSRNAFDRTTPFDITLGADER